MWNPELSITEAKATLLAQNDAIKSLRIIKEGTDFYVLMRLTASKDEFFLATQRTQKEPRRFRHIGRLLEYIESHFPSINDLVLVLKAQSD